MSFILLDKTRTGRETLLQGKGSDNQPGAETDASLNILIPLSSQAKRMRLILRVVTINARPLAALLCTSEHSALLLIDLSSI